MSFNIRYGLAADGENHWERRKGLALARIRAGAPDLLGLQECRDDAQAEFIRSQLPDYYFYGVQRGGQGDTALEMAPILFRTASFELIQAGQFWLSPTPQIAGSKGWDSVFARTATWVELNHRPSGRRLAFLNTHFDYQPLAIDAAAELLGEWTAQRLTRQPLVVTGDFNAAKHSRAYQRLTGAAGLADAYRQVHPGDDRPAEDTYHDFGQAGEPAAIDWILISPHFQARAAAVDRTRLGALFPSDHYPLTAALDWAGRAPATP